MKYLTLFALLFAGCASNKPARLSMFCRHQVLAQEARAIEVYDREKVTVVWLQHAYKRNADGSPATHAQIKVWHAGRFWFLPNRWSHEYFSATPQQGWIEQGIFDYPECLPKQEKE